MASSDALQTSFAPAITLLTLPKFPRRAGVQAAASPSALPAAGGLASPGALQYPPQQQQQQQQAQHDEQQQQQQVQQYSAGGHTPQLQSVSSLPRLPPLEHLHNSRPHQPLPNLLQALPPLHESPSLQGPETSAMSLTPSQTPPQQESPPFSRHASPAPQHPPGSGGSLCRLVPGAQAGQRGPGGHAPHLSPPPTNTGAHKAPFGHSLQPLRPTPLTPYDTPMPSPQAGAGLPPGNAPVVAGPPPLHPPGRPRLLQQPVLGALPPPQQPQAEHPPQHYPHQAGAAPQLPGHYSQGHSQAQPMRLTLPGHPQRVQQQHYQQQQQHPQPSYSQGPLGGEHLAPPHSAVHRHSVHMGMVPGSSDSCQYAQPLSTPDAPAPCHSGGGYLHPWRRGPSPGEDQPCQQHTGGGAHSDHARKMKKGVPRKPPAVRLAQGTRIRILWPRDGRWHKAQVKKFDPKKALHTVFTDHGDSRRVDLRVNMWELLEGEGAEAGAPFLLHPTLVGGVGGGTRKGCFGGGGGQNDSDDQGDDEADGDEDADEDAPTSITAAPAPKKSKTNHTFESGSGLEGAGAEWERGGHSVPQAPSLLPSQQPQAPERSPPPAPPTAQGPGHPAGASVASPLLRLPQGFFVSSIAPGQGPPLCPGLQPCPGDGHWLKLGLGMNLGGSPGVPPPEPDQEDQGKGDSLVPGAPHAAPAPSPMLLATEMPAPLTQDPRANLEREQALHPVLGSQHLEAPPSAQQQGEQTLGPGLAGSHETLCASPAFEPRMDACSSSQVLAACSGECEPEGGCISGSRPGMGAAQVVATQQLLSLGLAALPPQQPHWREAAAAGGHEEGARGQETEGQQGQTGPLKGTEAGCQVSGGEKPMLDLVGPLAGAESARPREEEWTLVLAVARRLQRDRHSGSKGGGESGENSCLLGQDEADLCPTPGGDTGGPKVALGQLLKAVETPDSGTGANSRNRSPAPETVEEDGVAGTATEAVLGTGIVSSGGALNQPPVGAGSQMSLDPASKPWVLGGMWNKDFLSLGPRHGKCSV